MMSAPRRSAARAAFAALLLACMPANARTLVFCSEANPESLDPGLVTTTTAMNATWQMFNNLVEFEPGSTTIRPALAQAWTVSEDGRTYTFELREGVRFHANARFTPSRPMNADDVVFSFARQLDPQHPYHAVGGAQFGYVRDLGFADLVESIERIDARHVRFRLKRPDSTFLVNLAQSFGGILSAEYAEALASAKAPELLATSPIGTGPFTFVGFRPDLAVRYRSFADYWRRPKGQGTPSVAGEARALDGLVFSITPNAAVRLTKLKAGECQVAAFPGPSDLASVRADPALSLLSGEELNVAYLALNTTRPPLNDVRVRRAINLAVDRSAIVEAIYGAGGQVAKNPLPPAMWSYDTSLPDIRFDRDEALRLLAEAGYPDGFETDLWYLPVSRPYNPNGRRVGDMIRSDLERVGIRANLKTESWVAYRTALYDGVPSMMLYGWTSDNGDPDNFLSVLLGCQAARPGGANLARWCDQDYENTVDEARRTDDRDKRAELYRKAQRIFRREVPWVPLAHATVHMALRNDVVGFRMDPLGRHLFEEVMLID